MDHKAASGMTSHRDIISRAGGPAAIGRRIGVDPNTAKGWKRLDSIPSAYWHDLARYNLATLEELARAAALKASDRSDSIGLICNTCERLASDPATRGCTTVGCGLHQQEAA